jgi:GT2 family glycosyltransferase
MKQSLRNLQTVDFKKQTMLDVSIIIVSYNTKELTAAAIKSVQKSKSQYLYEIIVIDNASTDGSVEKLELFGTAIKLIKNKTNFGFSKANNQGISIAKGKYIFLLNSDAELKSKCIDKLINFACEHKDAGAIVPQLLNADGSPQESVFKLPTLKNAILQYWFGQKGLYGQYVPEGQIPQKVESAVMAAFMITPYNLKKSPKLNEKYFMYFEDLDYCRQIQKNGLSIYYIPDAKVIHHVGKSGTKISDSENQWRRLVPSSKIYHGVLNHYLIWFVMRTSQISTKLK